MNILERLDFNAVNSGDPIARVYFAEAATRIRTLERDAAYFHRQLRLREADLRVTRREAGLLASALERANEQIAALEREPEVTSA